MKGNEINDDTKFVLTEWGCLASILVDYNIDFSHITPTMGKHMVEDFFNVLEKAGYIRRINNK